MDKALLVGINAYPGAPLAGCLNDVEDMARFVTGKCGFDPAAVRILTDARATTTAIKDRLLWLVTGLKPGDRILFHYSGHGAQVPTRDKKGEVDGLDEVICVAGDTVIPLLDGTEPTIAELEATGFPFWTYSVDDEGNIRPGFAVGAWMTNPDAPLVKVTLDNGKSVRCTPDHLWMMRDGTYRKAGHLVPGDSLVPLYRHNYKTAGGRKRYEETVNPKDGKAVATHKISAGPCPDETLVRAAEQKCGVVVHHQNFNHRDNRPENLIWMTWKDHEMFHHATPEARKRASERSKKRWADPETRRQMVAAISKGAAAREANPEMKRIRSEAAKNQDLSVFHAAGAAANSVRLREAWNDPEYRAKMTTVQAKEKPGTSEALRKKWENPEYRSKMVEAQRASMKRRWEDPEERRKMPYMANRPLNHKVVSVEPAGTGPVYDIHVPGFQNFAVGAGVFIHNCPVDFDWSDAHLIRDKDFNAIFKKIPAGVVAWWVSDSCHSGDLAREPDGLGGRIARRMVPPLDIQWRFEGVKSRGIVKAPLVLPNIALVSGCRSNQTSADATSKRRPNGALTRYLIDALSLPGALALPMPKIVDVVRAGLRKGRFAQVPQLEGPAEMTVKPFLKK